MSYKNTINTTIISRGKHYFINENVFTIEIFRFKRRISDLLIVEKSFYVYPFGWVEILLPFALITFICYKTPDKSHETFGNTLSG